MRKRQRQIIAEVKAIGKRRGWSNKTVRQISRMCLMCVGVESDAKIYANDNVPESFNYPHDAVGSDHLSVGTYQQQTPMWGTCEECMSITFSTRKFVHRIIEEFMPDMMHLNLQHTAVSYGAAVQHIQGSAFPDRYESEWASTSKTLSVHFLTTLPAKT